MGHTTLLDSHDDMLLKDHKNILLFYF